MKRYHINPVTFDGRGSDYDDVPGFIVDVVDYLVCESPGCPERHVHVIDEQDLFLRDERLIQRVRDRIQRVLVDDLVDEVNR